jgi:hypothetical protein
VQATQLDSDVETQLRAADLTYDHVGRTSGVLPDGYGHLNKRVILGRGKPASRMPPARYSAGRCTCARVFGSRPHHRALSTTRS